MKNLLNLAPSQELNDLFWNVFRASTSLMSITSLEERHLMAVNDTWIKTLKYDVDEVLGLSTSSLDLWPDLEHYQAVIQRLQNGEEITDEEVVLKAKDGTYLNCLMTINRVDLNGHTLLLASTHNITEERKAGKALASTQEMLIDALESISEGFVLYGEDGGLVICNSKFREFYGYSDEEASVGAHRKYLGQLDINRKTVLVEENCSDDYINRREIIETGPLKFFEVKLHDGRILMMSDHVTSNGGVVSIQSDITSSRKIEDALRRSQKMEAIGQLTGGIAHDFNNILNIILGNLELIEDIASDSKEIQTLAASALKGALRGAEITKKLLNFSSMAPSTSNRYSVNQLLANMEHLIAKSLTATITVTLKLSDDLWDVKVDSGDFEDAILNLSLNARDALDGEGALVIETSNQVLKRSPEDKGEIVQTGEFVTVSLKDTGIGMSNEVRQKIFDPFFTTKERGKGTGLGLSMVYGFIQRSGGHVTVQSEPGFGTTVTMYLPRTDATTKVKAEPEIVEMTKLGEGTILIVDDEAPLVDIAAVVLAKCGYKIVTASNGQQALDILSGSQNIDLLFTDIIMPGGIDGYQLAQKALDLNPDLKILVASGFTRRDRPVTGDEDELILKLSDNLLQKPYTRATLITKIQELLS